MSEVTKGSIFDDFGRDPGEAEKLKVKAAYVDALLAYIELHQLTQQEAADRMCVQRSRIADLMRGQISRFSVDMLITLAGRVGLSAVNLKIAA